MAELNDNSQTDAPAASSLPRHGPLQRMLQRGESTVASVGLALAAILLVAMTASGYWAMRTQQADATAARAKQVGDVAKLLGQSAESLLGAGEVSAVRLLVAETARNYDLSACRVVLSDGQVIASSDPSQVKMAKLPPRWNASKLPPLDPTVAANAVALNVPLAIAGRGAAALEIEARVSRPLWSYWEAQTGVGAIGVVALVGLLVVYRKLRSRLRASGAIRDALLALSRASAAASAQAAASESDAPPTSGGTALPASSLMVSPDLGPEARAWNDLINETERTRKLSVAEKARAMLDRRRQSKGDLDAACDAMSQGLLLVDERHRVKYANGAAAAFLGADRGQLIGGDVGQFLQVEKVLEAIRGVASGTIRRRTVLDIERKDEEPSSAPAAAGPEFHGGAGVLRFNIRPVRREDSASAMVIIEDVTQQKAAEASRHAFVAQATHELRTPLTNIRLYVETAIEDGENDAAVRTKCLNVINGEARRLERIVGEMLSVAEMEAGSLRLKQDDIRLETLLEELQNDFAEQAKDKPVELTFHLPPKLPQLQGDRDKVVMAVHNLLGNAIKYTPAGGKVAVTFTADAQRIHVAVKDTGIGISGEDAERIFERFYRAKDARVSKITGTGLGLTLAKEVARLHGGDVTVESQLNQGSTFTLTLPLKAVAA